MEKKIDRVYIINEDNISCESFPITKLHEAEARVKWLTEYHKCKFTIKIRNEYVDNKGFGISCRPSEVDSILAHKNQSSDLDITKAEMDKIVQEVVDGSTSGSTPYTDDDGNTGSIEWEFYWKKR